jgi:hypothetical protein
VEHFSTIVMAQYKSKVNLSVDEIVVSTKGIATLLQYLAIYEGKANKV